jgi:hypothetical protein
MPLTKNHLTIGRGTGADVTINDPGLSRVHASINAIDDKVWILDESSTNGSLVNGRQVPPGGATLSDRDEIKMGDRTSITISLSGQPGGSVVRLSHDARRERVKQMAGIALVAAVSIGIVLLGSRILSGSGPRRTEPRNQQQAQPAQQTASSGTTGGSQTDDSTQVPGASRSGGPATDSPTSPGQPAAVHGPDSSGHAVKRLYRQMTTAQQADYVEQQSRHVADMIGRRPCTFTPEVLTLIKYWVDAYARRVGNSQNGLWKEDLRTVFKRATRYTPIIIREFRKKEINDVIGVYIPMIETEYNNICYENRAGAMGLFQFTGPTARGMGLDPAERCDVKKMTPIAARYIADRLSEFGTDAVGVSLSIAGYNRSPDSVRRDLYNTIDPNNRERSFWTLVANKGKLDEWFQTENIAYVPRFFAAAIIGENPWDFGIDMNQLSTYTEGGDGD